MCAAGRVKVLTDALTLRAASGLESLRAGSAREALVAGAKLSVRAAKRVTEVASSVEEMPNVRSAVGCGGLDTRERICSRVGGETVRCCASGQFGRVAAPGRYTGFRIVQPGGTAVRAAS